MPFPTDINPNAIRQVIRFATGQDTDKGRVALAAYDVEGYILNKMFPDAAYVSDGLKTCPPPCPLTTEDPVIAELVAGLDGTPFTDILSKMLDLFGPLIAAFLANLLNKPKT